jgi:hypothetical protein
VRLLTNATEKCSCSCIVSVAKSQQITANLILVQTGGSGVLAHMIVPGMGQGFPDHGHGDEGGWSAK